MEYVYMQQAVPTDTTGVPIVINVVDANGNYRTIGTATSDSTGLYSLTWTPDIAGEFKIYASFAGTESYWPSQASTSFYAAEPAPTPTQQPATQQEPIGMYIAGAVAAIIVAIAIGFVVTIIVLKKRQ
jgi:hypothetical protein